MLFHEGGPERWLTKADDFAQQEDDFSRDCVVKMVVARATFAARLKLGPTAKRRKWFEGT